MLPRGDHRGAVLGGFVNAAEQVQRVRLELGFLACALDPTLGRVRIFRRQRELREVEGELPLIDHGARQLAERLPRGLGIAAGDQRLGLDINCLDQIGLLVDEVEGGRDRGERRLGIFQILQLDPSDADPRHRVVGAQLGEGAVLHEGILGVPTRIGDRGGERHDIGVLAVDPATALQGPGGIIDAALLEGLEAAFEVGEQAVGAGHAGRHTASGARGRCDLQPSGCLAIVES